MNLVVDASAVLSALVDSGPTGQWTEALLTEAALFAPVLIQVEVANVLRRASHSNEISNEVASLAYHDLLDLQIELFPYEPFAERIWALGANLTPYDAWYVAVAESIEAPLMTLDSRLAQAPGPNCAFYLPGDSA